MLGAAVFFAGATFFAGAALALVAAGLTEAADFLAAGFTAGFAVLLVAAFVGLLEGFSFTTFLGSDFGAALVVVVLALTGFTAALAEVLEAGLAAGFAFDSGLF